MQGRDIIGIAKTGRCTPPAGDGGPRAMKDGHKDMGRAKMQRMVQDGAPCSKNVAREQRRARVSRIGGCLGPEQCPPVLLMLQLLPFPAPLLTRWCTRSTCAHAYRCGATLAGSGKTAAFVLPMLVHIKDQDPLPPVCSLRATIPRLLYPRPRTASSRPTLPSPSPAPPSPWPHASPSA